MNSMRWWGAAALVALATVLMAAPASAQDRMGYGRVWGHNYTRVQSGPPMTWHGPYLNTEYGAPVALVVPPKVEWYGSYSWGMPASHSYRIRDQFERGYYDGYQGMPGAPMYTPVWPSSTEQFGVYYVRGPRW